MWQQQGQTKNLLQRFSRKVYQQDIILLYCLVLNYRNYPLFYLRTKMKTFLRPYLIKKINYPVKNSEIFLKIQQWGHMWTRNWFANSNVKQMLRNHRIDTIFLLLSSDTFIMRERQIQYLLLQWQTIGSCTVPRRGNRMKDAFWL